MRRIPGVNGERISDVEVIERLFAAFAEGDSDAVVESFGAEIVWVPTSVLLGDARRYEGHAGIRRWLRDLESSWDSVRFYVDERSVEPGGVLTVGRLAADRRGAGLASMVAFVHRVRDGKVVHAEEFIDIGLARRAARRGPRRELGGAAVTAHESAPPVPSLHERLRDSESRLRALVETSPSIVFELDAGGCTSYVNATVRRVLGYEPEQVVGRQFTDFLPPESPYRGMAVTELPLTLEADVTRADGTVAPLGVAMVVIEDDDGHPLGRRGTATDLGESRRREDALLEASERFRLAFHAAPVGMVLFDARSEMFGAPTEVNAALGEMLGYSEAELLERDVGTVLRRADLERERPWLERLLGGEIASYQLEKRMLRADGSSFWALVHTAVSRDSAGAPLYVIAHVKDIDERKRAERARAAIVESALDCIISMDAAGRIVEFNPAAEATFGYRRDDVLGVPLVDLIIPPALRERHSSGLERLRGGGEPTILNRRIEMPAVRSDGSDLTVELTITQSGEAPPLFTGYLRDLTEQKRTDAALRASEELFSRGFELAPIGIAVIDAAGRITRANDALVRLAGRSDDELRALPTFLDSLPPEQRVAAARAAAELRTGESDVYEDVWKLETGNRGQVYVSVHIAAIREGDGTVRDYFAQFVDVTEERRREADLRRDVEALNRLDRIQEAIDEDRLALDAQPIFDVRSGELVKNELLVRMVDADGERLRPAAFLPMAERYGLIIEIDRWVIRQAMRYAATGVGAAVNVSARSIGVDGLPAFIVSEAERAGADPSSIVFEITETALMADSTAGERFLRELVPAGFRFALDDFGTGFGTFTYLKTLPVDFLKIDIEFVADLVRNPRSQHVVRAVVSLASDFGLRTIAEGVEDEETLAMLREYGADFAQGYHLGRPLPLALDD